MAEEIKEDSNCIIKAFENNNITIIKEEPNTFLFKATDIGKILDLTNVRVSVQNFDEDEKCVRNAYTVRGDKDMIFLTSRGVYRLLYNSKKPIAKQFRKWVGNILDDLIFNQGIELKNQLEKYHLELQQKDKQLELKTIENIKDKESILLKSYDKKSIVYLIFISGILWKFGYTDNIKRRLSEHKREINQDIKLIYCIESKNNVLLENNLKNYLKNTNYRNEKIINEKLQTELIQIENINIIQIKLEEFNKSLIDDKQIILELKAEIFELKNKLENKKIKNTDIKNIENIKVKILELENERLQIDTEKYKKRILELENSNIKVKILELENERLQIDTEKYKKRILELENSNTKIKILELENKKLNNKEKILENKLESNSYSENEHKNMNKENIKENKIDNNEFINISQKQDTILQKKEKEKIRKQIFYQKNKELVKSKTNQYKLKKKLEKIL